MLEHEEISIEDENNKFEEVNYNRNDTFSNKINKGFMSIGSDDLLGSEEVLINLKKEIETVKKRNEAYHLKKESTQSMNNNITSNKNIDKIEYNNKMQTKQEEDKENNIKELNNDLIEFNINIDKNIFEYSGLPGSFDPSVFAQLLLALALQNSQQGAESQIDQRQFQIQPQGFVHSAVDHLGLTHHFNHSNGAGQGGFLHHGDEGIEHRREGGSESLRQNNLPHNGEIAQAYTVTGFQLAYRN